MARTLRYYGDPILRKKAEPLRHFDPLYLRELIEEMDEIMQANGGMGLAAPQVGESLRLFIFRAPLETGPHETELGPLEVFINPLLSLPTKESWRLEEGCLSLPRIHVEVERPLGITLEAQDAEGGRFIREAKGIVARAYMHENDHLNGVLTIDRLPRKRREALELSLRKIKATRG